MKPAYMKEKLYSYMNGFHYVPKTQIYLQKTPETEFEEKLYMLYIEAQKDLSAYRYLPALNKFRELMNLILKMVHPTHPVDPGVSNSFDYPRGLRLLYVLSEKAAELLEDTPTKSYDFPQSVLNGKSNLPASVKAQLDPLGKVGHHRAGNLMEFSSLLKSALDLIDREKWSEALKGYIECLKMVEQKDTVTRASLLHDSAILYKMLNNTAQAVANGTAGMNLFAKCRNKTAYLHSMMTMVDIYNRSGMQDKAKILMKKAELLMRQGNLDFKPGRNLKNVKVTDVMKKQSKRVESLKKAMENPKAEFMGFDYMEALDNERKFGVQTEDGFFQLFISGDVAMQIRNFHKMLARTEDMELVKGYAKSPENFMLYIPHLYFYVIPMAMADCHMGLGNLESAESIYNKLVTYTYINRKYEAVQLWSRMAELYLEMADRKYRNIKKVEDGMFDETKGIYEKIIKSDGKLDPNSILYRPVIFRTIKSRIEKRLKDSSIEENAKLILPVLEADTRLAQIAAGFNFFGFPFDYLPPFSFEHLQNTAKYFAQQASQLEQRYITYRSTHENEELREDQMRQQVELANETVNLEMKGVEEAQAGIDVAQASCNYANLEKNNAVAAKNEFATKRWELLELSELEAWANARSVKEKDEVKLEVSGQNYYSTDKKRRSEVLKDLAYRKNMLSHQMQMNKLEREIKSAERYLELTKKQKTQAEKRKAVAEKRVEIAELQRRHANENYEYMCSREFNSNVWYELSREARVISWNYLFMATETAIMMQQAYNAETLRNLSIIGSYFINDRTNNTMGPEKLLKDIDFFTLDYHRHVKSRRNPVKKSISLADFNPVALNQLKEKGVCYFETDLEMFEREHPGLYLCKIRNVELVFVGVTNASSVSGTIRNCGVSRFRTIKRGEPHVETRLYPADVMVLSEYNMKRDTLAFRFTPNELKLFENQGIDTLWKLELPKHANHFDLSDILDIHVVIYYDGFFSPILEEKIKDGLAKNGSSARPMSMKMMCPDELYYLKHQGNAEIAFEEDMFPQNQKNRVVQQMRMKVSGDEKIVSGLKMRLNFRNEAQHIDVVTDSAGQVCHDFDEILGKPVEGSWNLTINPEDNGWTDDDGREKLRMIDDVMMFMEYDYDYL